MYLRRNPRCCCRTNQNTRFIYFLALSTVLFHLHYKEKGPKCYFNGSFYRLSAHAACPRCCLHLGLCLGSQTEGYLADKASRGVWNMFYRCREGDLLFADMGQEYVTPFSIGIYTLCGVFMLTVWLWVCMREHKLFSRGPSWRQSL